MKDDFNLPVQGACKVAQDFDFGTGCFEFKDARINRAFINPFAFIFMQSTLALL